MRKASSRHGVDLPVYILVLDVVAGPFQLAPLINGHRLRFSLGYHGQTSLKLGISHCSLYHTLKYVRWERVCCNHVEAQQKGRDAPLEQRENGYTSSPFSLCSRVLLQKL